jgi:hypothetical protein
MKEFHLLKEFHFFAANVATWIATTDERTLPDVIRYMEQDDYIYSLFMVPGKWDSDYEIRHYAPQVEGTVLIGTYTPPNHRTKKKTIARKNKPAV